MLFKKRVSVFFVPLQVGRGEEHKQQTILQNRFELFIAANNKSNQTLFWSTVLFCLSACPQVIITYR